MIRLLKAFRILGEKEYLENSGTFNLINSFLVFRYLSAFLDIIIIYTEKPNENFKTEM